MIAARKGANAGRVGFTLVEVIVALTIAVMIVLVAHQLFAAVADRGRTLTAARAELDRAANARRWLASAFLSLDVGTEGSSGFDGQPDHIAFSAWLLTPDGWFERRHVTLETEQGSLHAISTPGMAIDLMDSVTDAQFDYLLEPGADSKWVREWVSPVSAPVAVRMRLVKATNGNWERGDVVDTLLFLIKERG